MIFLYHYLATTAVMLVISSYGVWSEVVVAGERITIPMIITLMIMVFMPFLNFALLCAILWYAFRHNFIKKRCS